MLARNINYVKRSSLQKHKLDVHYYSENTSQPVLMFIHGGSWMTGNKEMYQKLGLNLLKKDILSVIINYRLYPDTDVFGMVDDCMAAVRWTIQNIAEYGGDPQRLFIMGHSAGGHLSAVAGLHEEFKEHVKGIILIDAFGLAANHFLNEHSMLIPEFLSEIFTPDQKRWPSVSPEMLVTKDSPPCLIMTGGNTYPFLFYDNETFLKYLDEKGVSYKKEVIPGKSHMQMIWQFESLNSSVYKIVINWMENQKCIDP